VDTLKRYWWAVGIGLSVLVVMALAPLASGDPDGLERVGDDLGFNEAAQGPAYEILPDYTVPGLDDPVLSTIASGVIGILVVVAIMLLVGRLLARRRAGRA
jgi:PDGLE domain